MITVKDLSHFSITSAEGMKRYYDPMVFCRWCIASERQELRRQPTVEEAEEYLRLRNTEKYEKKERRNLYRLENYYDWRDIVTGCEGSQGLVSPDGKLLLPEIFQTVLRQSVSMIRLDDLIPVSNGEGFGLAHTGESPVMLTRFKYQNILIERWEHEFYFVQSKETGKWGALEHSFEYSSKFDVRGRKRPHFVKVLKEALPCDYDEIYEDEICTDCSPTLFWVFRQGDKLGILTKFGHTEAIYDGYETDCVNAGYTLYCNGIQMVIKHSLFEDIWQ